MGGAYMNNFDNIPMEMREYKQWCVWKYIDKGRPKLDKVPYKADGYPLSPTDPSDWMTWAQVMTLAPMYDGIGFIFHSSCPFAFIDLDNADGDLDMQKLQIKIFKEFDSYSEYSPSGKGLHIIIKGSIPEGKNYGGVELYSNGRFGTMTGNVFANKPIVERHNLLNQLYNQLNEKFGRLNNNSNFNVPDIEETQTDETLLELAFKHNSEKFIPLSLGEWQGKYPSQSEADQAYMNIIAAYTDNRNQVIRIYSKSKLAKTDKKRTTQYYLNKTVNTAFDQKIPDIVFNGYEKYSGPVAQRSEPIAHNGLVAGSNPVGTTNTQDAIIPPFGLLGEIAQFIYSAAPRQIPEIAIGGAIGLMAGICGRAFNINGTGLNQYVLCLATTGMGKEAAASGIDKIINEVQKQIPVASEFIGPSEIASGQALIKYVSNKSQSFVSIIGEFGIRLQIMSDLRANSSERTLRKVLLQLYQKSGHDDVLRSSAYADKEKNTNDVSAPAFSILAESTPETVYETANENMITDGLLPRFIILEYKGKRQYLNKNHYNIRPSKNLVDNIADLMAKAKMLMAKREVIQIKLDEEVIKLFTNYDKETTDDMNLKDAHKAIKELWNRADLKVLKLAGLVAIGINMNDPVVTKYEFDWARNIIESGIHALSKKFESGEVGINSNELKQVEELTRILKEYVEKDFQYVSKYKATQSLHISKIICNTYLSLRLTKMAAFRNDKVGGTNALKRTIQIMIDNGILKLAGGLDFQNRHKITGKAYYININ